MASGKDASRVRSRRSFAQMPRLGSADKENTTSDLSAISRGSKDDSTGDDLAAQRKREKRLRSKSLGPGGVAGLQSDAKGRRQSAVSSFPLKSILKPTIPLSPVQPIPSFEETRRRTPGRTPQQASSTAQPAAAAPASELNDPSASPPGPASSQNPYDSFSPVGIPLRTEEQQQAAAREREEQERQERKKQALEHREARRKSLANRRVSFAPEATLHTWNVIEANDDSTTSSAANSTRQESQLGDERDAGDNVAPSSSPESAGPVSTPDASRRRSQVGDRSPDDNVSEYEAFSSSPFGSVIEDGGSIAGRGDEADDDDGGQDDSGSGSDSDPGDTVMTMDTATEHSVVSSDESTNKLDGNLRQAAEEAGTRGIDYDENGDLSMEFTEIQGAFQPWIKKGGNISAEDMTTKFGHDDLAFEQALAGGDVNNQPHAEDTGMITGDISMDITSALGQIMQQPSPVDAAESTTPIDGTPDRRHSSAVDREDQTMEFTAVVGGLSQTATAQHDEPQSSPFKPLPSEHSEANDGDATMELTSVFGDSSIKRGRQWDDFESEDEQRSESGVPETTAVTNFDAQDMEFTRPMGGILSPIVEQTEPQEDVSFTTRVDTTPMREGALVAGAALDAHHSASQQSSDSGSSSRRRHSDTQRHPTAKVSENGSPMPGSPLRMPKTPSDVHTNEHTLPQTPEERLASPTATPGEVPATPDGSTPEQAASVPQEDVIYPELPQDTESPGGGPIGATQPRAAESPEQVTPQRAPSGKPSGLFAENGQHGQATPSFVLRPQLRQTSGLGVDKDGLGSPHVAELLDRRRSIGDEAESFNPAVVATHGVRFNAPDPEARLERQRHAMGPDLDLDSARDATSNLKDLIQSMSPKKKRPAKSIRKSLHTGSARGLLGKRPAELNMEDEEEDLTPKRFRSVEGSPVKSVRLLPPPTKDQTTGRVTSQIDPSNQSAKAMISTTPRVALTPLSLSSQPQSPVLVNQPASVDPQELPQGFRVSQDYQPISLQEFLDMTNVQFMELNTTKRRHTVAPQDQPRTSRDMGDKEVSFADRAVAATTTVPLLEMYQHACNELKKYITEGRAIIKTIEEETMKENPPLFREYHSAPSGLRAVMDNQFRNVKTNARLQSKAMWYEWRMKLLSGLQEGLNKHEQDLQHDENVIATKEASVNESLPQLLERHGKLEADVQAMRDRVKHLSSTNRDEMRVYHTKLMQTDGRLAHTTEELNKTQAQLDEMTEALSSAAEMKTELLRETRESERVLAARRACGLTEMRQLRVTVRELENSTGWQVTGAADDSDPSSGPRLMMCYRGELTVTFDPNAVNTDATKQAAWIKLAYSPRRPGSARGPARSAIAKVLMCTAIQDLVVAGLAAHGPRDLLRGIARSWDRAVRLDSEIQHLRFCGITRARTINDQQVVIRCSLALAQASSASSRTDIDFGVTTILVSDTEVDFVVRVSAVAVYGADDRIAQRVASELGKTVGGPFTQSAGDTTSRMSWKEALASCESRLLRRAV